MGATSSFLISPPILIVAEKNPIIKAALLAADTAGNNNGLIDNSGEVQAAVESLQKKLSDEEYEQFISRVVTRIKANEATPAGVVREKVILSPQEMSIPSSFYHLKGNNIYTVTEPFKQYDVTHGIRWKFDGDQLTAEDLGNITGKKPNAFFISAPINTKGAKNIVVTVVKMTGKFPLDGTGSGVEVNFPWSDSPDKLILPWLPKFEHHQWKETADSEVVRVTNLKEGDRLVQPLGNRENVKVFLNVLMDKGESISFRVGLE